MFVYSGLSFKCIVQLWVAVSLGEIAFCVSLPLSV